MFAASSLYFVIALSLPRGQPCPSRPPGWLLARIWAEDCVISRDLSTMITIHKPDVATGHFESIICWVLCRIVIVVMRASCRCKAYDDDVFLKLNHFSLYDVWNWLARSSSASELDTGTWQMDCDIFLMDWLEIELVKSRTKAYEADPTEDIRFTILLLAPLMMNTEYLSQYLVIIKTEMMKLNSMLSGQNWDSGGLALTWYSSSRQIRDCECRKCVSMPSRIWLIWIVVNEYCLWNFMCFRN